MPAPVPMIPPHQLLVFLLQAALLIALAVLLGRAARRVGLPPIVGELCVGIIVGPTLLAHVAGDLSAWLLPRQAGQFHLLDAVGQIGVMLLVGLTGVELDAGLVRRRGGTAVRISAAGLLLPLALGIGVGLLLPATLRGAHTERPVFALFLGVAMCVSAMPVIAKTLTDMRLLHRNIGQLILVSGSVDDAFGWLMLSVVSALATTGVRAGDVGRSVGSTLAVVVVALTAGRLVVRAVMRRAARAGGAVVVAAAVALMLGGAAGTLAVGLEPIFGAFLAGALIGASGAPRVSGTGGASGPSGAPRVSGTGGASGPSGAPRVSGTGGASGPSGVPGPPGALGSSVAAGPSGGSGAPVLSTGAALAPLRTLVLAVFAPLFFATAGLRVDLTVLRRPDVLGVAALLLFVAVAGKFGGAFIGALLCRLNRWEALALGAGMNARGVVEIVVAMAGLRLGVLNAETYTIVVLIAILTSVMAPPILRWAMRKVEHTAEETIRLERSAASPVD
ncbi:cation:proton antiporter [Dactylosporangium aurantiacum]|uniref:Cation:proton antiporter n=1 Tax=Dactylosporangium aurantiacum TaxID=35754 RepID=A0A9Q9MH81_9ACTN|nr:cation:proton antiporter [Dactylosporangium aurantiacum]UWZ52376.1 cation:proton antiporter [Dactylosporangium aurantiacum]